MAARSVSSGIEPADKAKGRAALAAMLIGREVTLRGADDTPDRYGRQPAFVFVPESGFPAQGELLKQGAALVSPDVTDKDCAALLLAAEAEARAGKRGIWADPAAIKNAESSGDILAGIGRFAVVEGKVLSVRTGRGNDLPQFRAELDTGLCCDYFEAHSPRIRGGRAGAQVPRKSTDSCAWLHRGAHWATDRIAPGGAGGSAGWELGHDPEKWSTELSDKIMPEQQA